MPEFNYIDDLECNLVGGDVDGEIFTIESPNGDGIYDLEISSIEDRRYIDAEGIIRKGFMEYDLLPTFYYSSHKMELLKLLQANEIMIPFPILLTDDPIWTRCVLLNEELVYNFAFDQPYLRKDVEKKYPHGEITLEFSTVHPFTMYEIRNLILRRDAPDIDTEPEGTSFDSTDTSNPTVPEGELTTSFET